jgi:hypothetical protein
LAWYSVLLSVLGKRKAGNLKDFLLVALWLLMQYSSFSLPQ